ncbi:Transposase [Pseudomonas syringae pv. maculicola]|uniref:transposase n=1 Tax=Pseudomonas syringae group genomosp. 3 TaxID=251701 RepID=UPI0006CCF450|nr:transposase [Pseudomonas syringae group genomosp. 3]KPB91009.1 Transposase [Pseudomonas syringae pv. maculicola]
MILGSAIRAPNGFGPLSSESIVYFLTSDGIRNRSRVVVFDDYGKQAHIVTFTRLEFEDAIRSGLLVEDFNHDWYPPWLQRTNGISQQHLESERVAPRESYDAKLNRRFAAIAHLVARAPAILSDENLESLISQHAKDQAPQQNSTRLKLWFLAYMIFGQDKRALMPRLHQIGHWDRSSKTEKRLGRRGKRAPDGGYPVTEDMKSKILSGFSKHNSPEKSENTIYRKILVDTFGCIVIEGSTGLEFWHPHGQPFPSFDQFKYWIIEQTTARDRTRARLGPSKARSLAGFIGRFSDSLCNVNQLVEFDGFYPSAKLSGVTEGSAQDSFCVVRGTCVKSGAVVALGFARGHETMEAYRMALFCMAIGKEKFAELFGVTLKAGDWSSVGLSKAFVFDRGPAAAMNCEDAIDWLSRLELTPTHSGQSKASVESSHPREKQSGDQPTHFQSNFNFVMAARAEIYRAIEDNRISDASGRMTEEDWLEGFAPSPNNIFKRYDSLGRNSAVNMPFEKAVRVFLTPYPVSIRRDGVYLYSRRYNSQSVSDTGVFDRIARNGVIEIQAYVLTMCVRHIWIELDGELHELSMVLSAGVEPDSSDITLDDLALINEARLQAQSLLRVQKMAVPEELDQRFQQDTGQLRHSGTRKLGRPKKDAASKRDEEDFKAVMGGKK